LLRVATNTKSNFEPSSRKLSSLVKIFQDGKIDAPIVACGYRGIIFVDGRHRTFLAAKLGFSTIKIAVVPEEKIFIRSFLEGVTMTI